MENSDWRLQEQYKYLLAKILTLKHYAERKTTTDHDHCEFCSAKFSEIIPDCLRSGYTTADYYQWICEKCFIDFKELFTWTTV